MKKIIFYLLILSALLFACSAEEVQEADANKDPVVEAEKESLPTSEEEWQLTLADSDWYAKVKEADEVLFERFLDFNGDGIQELIIGTNSMENQVAIHIGEYKIEAGEWSNLHTESYDYLTYMEPRLYGVLNNGDGTQVAAISMLEAGASANREEFRILRYRDSNTQGRIIDGFTYESNTDLPNVYSVNEEMQQIIIDDEFMSETYTLKDNILTNEDGYKTRLYTGVPITINQEFINFLDNTYFESGTYFGDESHDAKSNDPNLADENNEEGGYSSLFEDYSVYYGYEDPIINTIELRGFDNLLFSRVEEIIGEQIKKESYYNERDGTTENYAEFMFDGYEYHAKISSISQDAIISS